MKREKEDEKRPYEKPVIVYSDKIYGRAIRCARQDDIACPGGPITS